MLLMLLIAAFGVTTTPIITRETRHWLRRLRRGSPEVPFKKIVGGVSYVSLGLALIMLAAAVIALAIIYPDPVAMATQHRHATAITPLLLAFVGFTAMAVTSGPWFLRLENVERRTETKYVTCG